MNGFRFFLIISALFTYSIKAATTQPSNTILAVRTIRFEAKSESERLQIATQIAQGGIDDAIYFIAGACVGKSENGRDILSFSVNPAGNEIKILVDLHEPKQWSVVDHGEWVPTPSASEAADQAAAALIQSLTPSTREDLRTSMEQILNLQSEQSELFAQTTAMQAFFRDKSGIVDVSSSAMHQLLSSLQAQEETYSLDLAAKEARAEALENQIAKLTAQMADKAKDDPIIAELQKASDARLTEADLRKAQHEQGVATATDVTSAIAIAAEAKAKVLERHESVIAAAGGEVLSTLNKELMSLSVDLSELRARLKAIRSRLDNLHDASELLDQADKTHAQFTSIDKELEELRPKIAALKLKESRDHVEFKIVSKQDVPVPTIPK